MDDDNYDPHIHRAEILKNPTTNVETLFHLIKGCLGTGVLAMPEAFKMAGMINGIVSTLIIGAFCTYCLHVLVGGQYVLCKKRKVGLLIYSDSMKAACEVGPESFQGYGSLASGLTDFTLIFYQTGTCCIYIVFIGTNLKQVLDVYTPSKIELYIYMLALFIPCYMILCVKNLKLLAPFSMAADAVTMITFAVVFYYIFANLNEKFTDRPAFGKILNYPLFFGTVMFSLQSVPIIIAVENNMKTPEYFRKPFGALNIGFSFLTVVYACVAVLGYWRYGEKIESTITMNFPVTDILAQVIMISFCLAIYISYGLNAYVPITILWENYIVRKLDEQEASDVKRNVLDYLLRLLFNIVTFVFATTVPLLGLIISLVGSVCLSVLGIIFPAFIEIAANWEEEKSRPRTVMFWKNILLVVIGIMGMLSGAYSSIRGIVETLISGEY